MAQIFVGKAHTEKAECPLARLRFFLVEQTDEDRAQLSCIFEEEAWRVELALPPLPPVQMRPGSSP